MAGRAITAQTFKVIIMAKGNVSDFLSFNLQYLLEIGTDRSWSSGYCSQ